MAGIENNILFGGGEKLQTSSADDINRMQRLTTDVSRVNFVGNPNGNVSANPSSLCHDPVSGNVYFKQTGTGNAGWSQVGSGAGTVTSVSGTTNRTTSTGGTTPVIDIAATYVGQTSITILGTIATGVWNGTSVDLAHGGTNASLTASNGGLFYSTASAAAILAGTAVAGRIPRSGANTTPAWSTATYPATGGTSANVLTSDGTNFVSTIPAYVIVTQFTASGTWTRNANTKMVMAYMVSGGGGGGGGIASSTSNGGGGGSGGTLYINTWFSNFPSSGSVTIGAGGTAGVAGNGGQGGSTVFAGSTILGGAGGSIGAVGGGIGGNAADYYDTGFGYLGKAGGNGGTTTGGTPAALTMTKLPLSGGGGAGGASGGTGGTGGSYMLASGTPLTSGGAGGTNSGSGTAGVPLNFNFFLSTLGATAGGGGGGGVATAGSGGAGGAGGGGGGGGGSATTGGTPGNGGVGGRGEVWVVEFI
jgi:hypothetical protein